MPGSSIRWVTLPRSCLGVLKRFGVYVPPGFRPSAGPYPVLYLLRGHETEWVGMQDGRPGLRFLLDRLIGEGLIDPLVVVFPGFMDRDRRFQGIPVNWSADGVPHGVGNGRMEDHFFEVRTWVQRHLPVRTDRWGAAIDGFSMGGYSAVMLATRYPRLFGSIGAYDGSFMWPGQIDPRRPPHGRACRLWFSETCSPYFRRDGVWDRAKMERHNPITIIEKADGDRLKALKRLVFHLHVAGDERWGNVERGIRMDLALQQRGIVNSFRKKGMILDRRARHTWLWADRHLQATLPLHMEVFRSKPPQ